MSAEVLFVGSIICLISSFFKPFDSFYPLYFLAIFYDHTLSKIL